MDKCITYAKQTYADCAFNCDNNGIDLVFSKGSYRIIFPSKNIDHYLVHSKQDNTWIDRLNIRCMRKQIDLKGIIDAIAKNHQSSKPENSLMKEQMRIATLGKKSGSTLTLDHEVKKIFSADTITDAIISEYMNIFMFFKEEYPYCKITTNNDNLFCWTLQLSGLNSGKINRNLAKINEKFGYNYIELEVHIHPEYYPNYPPVIKVIRPVLKNMLMQRLTVSKLINFKNWNPTRSMRFIVSKIINIIETFGDIDTSSVFNNAEDFKYGAYSKIDEFLFEMNSLLDITAEDDIDRDIETVKTVIIKESAQAPVSVHWKSGTGFGHSGATKWDIDKFLKMAEEKNKKLMQKFDKLLDLVTQETDILKHLEHSPIIQYMEEQFSSSSLLDVQKNEQLFQTYFAIICMITLNDPTFFLRSKVDILTPLQRLKEKAEETLKIDPTNTAAKMVIYSCDKLPKYPKIAQKIDTADISAVATDQYIEKLSKLKNGTINLMQHNFQSTYVLKLAACNTSNMKQCIKRLSTELPSLRESIDIHPDSSVFIRTDSSNYNILRVLITGPPDTPYDSGCFIFDVFMGSDYPHSCPEVHFLNTGGVRFNPNLYDSGKVCLSLLGTYVGPTPEKSERWISNVSTLYQVIISIQAQILIDEPYFNEPGYESRRKTPSAKQDSEKYNANIQKYTINHAMCDLIEQENAYGMGDVIKEHFRIKKEKIRNQCKKWTDESKSQSTYERINRCLDDI